MISVTAILIIKYLEFYLVTVDGKSNVRKAIKLQALTNPIMTILRVRTFSNKTFRVYHVYSNFILGYICRITVIFGAMKDGSLLINMFASNNCFNYRNIFQNGVDALSKTDDAFSTKS